MAIIHGERRLLEVMRESGFTLHTSCAALIDNAYDAGATVARVRYDENTRCLMFADNGTGIKKHLLEEVLKLGSSSHSRDRDHLGRYGMGLKLGALALGRRIDIYSRAKGEGEYYYHAYLDLESETLYSPSNRRVRMLTPPLDGSGYNLMSFPTGRDYRPLEGKDFETGTLIMISKLDGHRTTNVSHLETKSARADLRHYLARTYRELLVPISPVSRDNARPEFYLDVVGDEVIPYDPLRLVLTNEHSNATIIDEGGIKMDGKEIYIRVAISPRGKDNLTPEEEECSVGIKVSWLRNLREIVYAEYPAITGRACFPNDKYIGIEISFPAELDSFFNIGYLKDRVEPISKLRERIRQFLERPIERARRAVKDWN